MDIKRAKQEIEHAVKAYLAVDDTERLLYDIAELS